MKSLGVKVSDSVLGLSRIPNIDVLRSLESELDFAETLKLLADPIDVEVEPKGYSGDVDVRAVVDGKTIVFQVKSLHTFRSKVMKAIIRSTEEFTRKHLQGYGRFVKAIFIPQQSWNPSFTHVVIERRKVNADVNASYGVLLYPVDLLTHWILCRVCNCIKESYRQLKSVDADYRVTVVDVRTEPVNEFTLWKGVQSWLCGVGSKYPRLSGVILVRYNFSAQKGNVGTWFIPIVNSHAEKPLDPNLLLRNITLPKPLFRARHVLILPAHIRISEAGWVDLIQIEPGFKIYYKGVYFGTLV